MAYDLYQPNLLGCALKMLYSSGSPTFFVDGVLWKLTNTRSIVMKPKFGNFKFYQKIVFKSCSLFKMHKNVSVYSQSTEKCLMWVVSLLLYAHFIKLQCSVWYCNTHVMFNVNLIAVLWLDYCYGRKKQLHTSMTLQTAQEHGELYSLQVEIQIEP